MNENTKTVVLVLVAAVIAVGVWWTKPRLEVEAVNDPKGELVFPDFKDPLAATSLEVIKYDEPTGDVSTFKVAQVKGVWSIPSHENYPADAKEHLAAAAADLVDLKIVSLASDSPVDHELYGVLDPTDSALRPGTPGVGMKIVMAGKDGAPLVSLIVGKADRDHPGLRYVRRTGQDAVLLVPLSTDKLAADFDAWIEKDLLKLNAFDIREIFIQDYTVDEVQGALEQRSRITLAYEEGAETPWKMVLDEAFTRDGWKPVPLGPNEELNVERLNQMRNALDDLKIVDVARKPEGLSADLAASKAFTDNAEARNSLAQRGFYVAKVSESQFGLYSNQGETRCLMQDGVEYVLRFGNLAGSGTPGAKLDDEGNEDDGGVNRYLFVMAEFNPSPIEKPKLQPLPDLPEVSNETTKPAEAKSENVKAQEEKPEGAKPENTTGPEGNKAEGPKPEKPKTAEELKAQREQIERDNKRKQEEYEERIAAGKKRVEELNARFANWYYIISESTYKKIHLGRKDVVQPKAPKKPGPGQPQPPGTPAGLPGADDHSPRAFDQLDKDLAPGGP